MQWLLYIITAVIKYTPSYLPEKNLSMCCRNEKPMKNVTLLGMSELMKNTLEVFSLFFSFYIKRANQSIVLDFQKA